MITHKEKQVAEKIFKAVIPGMRRYLKANGIDFAPADKLEDLAEHQRQAYYYVARWHIKQIEKHGIRTTDKR